MTLKESCFVFGCYACYLHALFDGDDDDDNNDVDVQTDLRSSQQQPGVDRLTGWLAVSMAMVGILTPYIGTYAGLIKYLPRF